MAIAGTSAHGKDKISLGAAIIVAMNAMIGAGVLAMPAVLAQNVGPASILSFVISIGVVLCIGLTLGWVADKYPGEGWNYRYPSQWAGHTIGMISAYAYLIGVIVAMGFLVQQAGVWVNRFIPWIHPQTLGITTLSFLAFLVLSGAKVSSWGQYVIAFFVITPLILTSIVCLLNMNPALFSPFMPGPVTSIFYALPTAMFGFLGFESVASLYAIVQQPKKNVPRAFITAIIAVGSLYLLFVCGIIFSIPAEHFAGGLNQTLAGVLYHVFPTHRFLATSVLIGATFGIIGTLHSMVWSVSTLMTVVIAKTRIRVIQNAFKTKVWNDSVSVVITASLMLLVSLVFAAQWLMPLTVLFIVPSYLLSCLALLFIKSEWRNGKNIVALIAIFGGSLLVYFALQATLSLL